MKNKRIVNLRFDEIHAIYDYYTYKTSLINFIGRTKQ